MTSLPGRDPADPRTVSWRAVLLSVGFALAVVLISAGTIVLGATGDAVTQVRPKQLVPPDWVGNPWVMYEPTRVREDIGDRTLAVERDDSERLTVQSEMAHTRSSGLPTAGRSGSSRGSPWQGGGFLGFGAAALLGAVGLLVWLALFTKTDFLRARSGQ